MDKLSEYSLKKYGDNKRKLIANSLMNNQMDFRKENNNLNPMNTDSGNKIDIKISVNYGKNGAHAVVNSGNNLNNTNISSYLSNSKSKSFYQQQNQNSFLHNSSNIQAPDYLNTNNDKGNS